MKDTKKRMTLSGQIGPFLFSRALSAANTKTILEYTNVLDIKKAWRVVDFRVWLASSHADIGMVADGLLDFRVQLNTDEMKDGYWDASDNRAIAWGEIAYASQAQYGKPAGSAGAPMQNINTEYYIKPDHIVQTRLDLSVEGTGSGTTTEGKDFLCNYIVYLEQYDITPQESIVFNIKSKGQDLTLL